MPVSRFSRNKERQMWLILVTIAVSANTFLILFHQSCWTHPASMALVPPVHTVHNPPVQPVHNPPVQPDGNVPQINLSLESLLRPDGQFPQQDAQLKHKQEKATGNVPAQPSPQHAERVAEEQAARKPQKKFVQNKKVPSPRGGALSPLPSLRALPQNNTKPAPRLPWLDKPKNMTRLQQVIHSLKVVLDNESAWKRSSYFELRAQPVTSFRPEVLINSVHCPSRGPQLLILIPSVQTNVGVRKAIRNTWTSPAYGAAWPGSTQNFTTSFKVVFFLGVKTGGKSAALEKESRQFHDIVQVDFQESYRNLSLKVALAMEWSSTYCPGARHVMKVDEDTFVDIPLLLDLLKHLAGRGWPRFVLGFHHFKQKPPVVRSGRWAVSKDLYPFKYFPRYMYGHSYVFSSEAVTELKSMWRFMPLVPNEDAYMTGILAKVAGITRIHCDWFAREDYLYPKPMPKGELARGRSVSQTGFKSLQKLNGMWEMVKKARGDGR